MKKWKDVPHLPPAPAGPRDLPDPTPNLRRYDAESLLDGANEFRLTYRGQAYAVRVTAAGKLIMTK